MTSAATPWAHFVALVARSRSLVSETDSLISEARHLVGLWRLAKALGAPVSDLLR